MKANKTIIKKLQKLQKLWRDNKIDRLERHEVNPGLDKGSRENYLYFTLPCCINFQRSSPATWQSALATWNDSQTNYVFFPEKVVATDYEKFKTDLLKHKLALQQNKHPHIWHTICTTFHKYYNNDPREFFKEAQHDILQIVPMLQKEKKSLFPYLSGPKLSNYWPFITSLYTDLKLKNAHELSIIPDTHVIKSTIHLGLADSEVKPQIVEQIWRDVLQEAGIASSEMHCILWNWSRAGFEPSV